MTLYNVHIYREMLLKFERIEADTPEAAAAIASDKPTSDAVHIDDCDGETFSALADVIGDEEFEQSKMIDFEPERLRRSAEAVREALKALVAWADDSKHKIDCGDSERRIWFYNALEKAHAVLAEANAERRPA